VEQEQYKNIENKIRDAAQHYEPAFDEGAWDKMEQILDAEKKPDRKPIMWLWFLLPVLLCAIGILLYTNHKQHAALIAANEVIAKEKTAEKNIGGNSVLDVNNTDPRKSTPTGMFIDNMYTPVGVNPQQGNIYTPISVHSQRKKSQSQSSKTAMQITSPAGEDDPANAGENETFNSKTTNVLNAPLAELHADSVKPTAKKATAETKQPDNNPNTKTAAAKEKKKAISKFYLTAAIGGENSGTKLLAGDGKTTAKYSAALGYNITKRLSVQAGVNAVHKIYSAPGTAYNPKAGTYLSRVKIIKLSANCMVYEIPVTVRYDFLQRNKMNYFATAGASSYIMKSEDYDYYYIRNGTYLENPYSYYGNKHFLSVVNLSAGAERKLSNKLSVQIEPSVSIPIKGVGDGRVKLFSAGINIGAKYFPFRKK
jgi:hypothetical protein